MSEDMDQIVENLKQPSAWMRVVFMIGFTILLYLIVAPLILVLMIVQALFTLVTGESNPNLRYLGAIVAQYVLQILEFISYNSDTKPFPFADFPGGETDSDFDSDAGSGSDSATATGTRSAAPKRKTGSARKTTGTRKAKTGNSEAKKSDAPAADP